MLAIEIYPTLAQAIPSVAPVVPVVDPRSTVELLIQAAGAVVMLVGLTMITRQIIYKQFGRETYAAAEFRKGMLKGALWLMLGSGIIAAAIILSPRLR
jgi:hypothetical protein